MKGFRAVAFLMILPAALPCRVDAYPISPVTLWHLVAEADAVVFARVARIELGEEPSGAERARSDHFEGDRDIAVLEIQETWKGEISGEVRVSFSAGLVCPAPPRFVVGETMVAFLERGETSARLWREAWVEQEGVPPPEPVEPGAYVFTPEEWAQLRQEEKETIDRYDVWSVGRWLPVAFSYGTLYPDESDRPVFRDLVRRAASLQAAGIVDDVDRREWMISAAERRATRWQGLYELAPKSDALHFYYDQGRSASEPLTGEDLARLAASFVREPSVDQTLSMLLDLLAPYPDPAFDRAAVSAIEAALATHLHAWWLPDAISRTLERFGDASPGLRFYRDDPDCQRGPVCVRVDPAALPRIWQEARRELGIPPVAPLIVPEHRVSGVGSETPD